MDTNDATRTGIEGGVDQMPLSAARVPWEMSESRRTARVLLRVVAVPGILLVVGGTVLSVVYLAQGPEAKAWAGAPMVVLGALLVVLAYLLFEFRERRYQQEFFRAAADEHLRNAARDHRRQTLAELIQFNRAEMERYQCLAQAQAASMYRAGRTAATVGLAVLVVAVVATLGMDSVAAKAAAGATGVVGAGLSAYIGRTFLTMYRMSMQQMSYYYGQPHVACYLLHAEHLVNDLNEPDATAARKKILTTILTAAERAQQQVLIVAGTPSRSEAATTPLGPTRTAVSAAPNGHATQLPSS